MNDNKLLIASLPCQVCNRPGPSDVHHWKTRGAGGTDDLENLVSLCRNHHMEFHSTGRKTFWHKHKEAIKLSRARLGIKLLKSLED